MKVHEFLDSPDKWTKNAYARDASGLEVSPDDFFAVSWNLSGAINYCYFLSVPPTEKTEEYKRNLSIKMHQIIGLIGTPDVWEWENFPGRTFEEIKTITTQVDI